MLFAGPVNVAPLNAVPGVGVRIRLEGEVVASASASAAVTRLRGTFAAIQASATATGRMYRLRPLTATVHATASASATVGRITPLSAAVATASATATAGATATRSLSASITAAVTVTADLSVDPRIEQLEAQASATTSASATLYAIKGLAATAFAMTGATANLSVLRPLSAQIEARATASGNAAHAIVTLPSAAIVAAAEAFGGTPVAIVDTREPEYRTVSVINDAATLRPRTFQRQPGDYLPYDIDMEEWLAPFPGDGIESVQVDVTEANGQGASIHDLDVSRIDFVVPMLTSPPPPAIRAKVWVQGGVSGATYKVTVRCTTIGDRVKEADFRLSVNEV